MTNTMTKQKSVIKYLSSGRSLNQDRAMKLFGVRNFRATISDVKQEVERYGNWRIVRTTGRDGTSRYSMKRIRLTEPTNMPVGGRKKRSRPATK